jgi:hypothetical protein
LVYFYSVGSDLPWAVSYWRLDLELTDMKQEDIIRMAREADPKANLSEPYCLDHETGAWLEAFAALVAAEEREECAKVCDDLNFIDNGTPAGTRATNRHCAAAIRTRGQA